MQFVALTLPNNIEEPRNHGKFSDGKKKIKFINSGIKQIRPYYDKETFGLHAWCNRKKITEKCHLMLICTFHFYPDCMQMKASLNIQKGFSLLINHIKMHGQWFAPEIALKVTWMYSFWLKGKLFFLPSSILWFSVVRIANNCRIYYQLRWSLGHSLCTRVKVKRTLPCDSMWDLKLHLNGYSPGSWDQLLESLDSFQHMYLSVHLHQTTWRPSNLSVFCLFWLHALYIFSHSETPFST